MMRQVVEQFGEYAKLNKKLGEEAAEQLGDIDDASSWPIPLPPNQCQGFRQAGLLSNATR